MLTWINKRLSNERGFTLIELMVVVLIIAILIAIAIPTFLGARKRAQDRAAQSGVRNAFTAEKTFYTDGEEYTATAADMTAIEPSLTYVTGASDDPKEMSLAVSTNGQTVVVGAYSVAGNCFFLKDIATGSGAGTTFLKTTNQTSCTSDVTTTGFTADGWS
jgi:type IV pilus assembly protein PilA